MPAAAPEPKGAHAMADTAVLDTHLAQVREGESLFERVVSSLSDDALDKPGLLPDWRRRHIIAHVAANARALGRLLYWARTGEETPMYPDVAARNAEIEQDAARGAEDLRAMVADSAARLQVELDGLPPEAWQAEVRNAQGGIIPAGRIPWMRCRELWVHAVDLDGSVTFSDLPEEIVDALAADVLTQWEDRGEEVDRGLAAADRGPGRPGRRIPGAGTAQVVASGPAASLTAWLTGRAEAPPGIVPAEAAVPALPRWL
jgi:maleylpyruvate isomerase